MDEHTIDDRWERLLLALQQANNLPKPPEDEERESTLEEDVINGLACEIFITSAGRINYCEVNAFEKYANCKITPAEQDSFGWLIGRITYGGRKYYFG